MALSFGTRGTATMTDQADEKIISLRELGLLLGNAAVEDRRGSTPEFIGHVIGMLAGGLVERGFFDGETVADDMLPFMEALSRGSGGKIEVHLGDDLADVIARNPEAFKEIKGQKTRVISVSADDDATEVTTYGREEVNRAKAVADLLKSLDRPKDDDAPPEEHRGSRA